MPDGPRVIERERTLLPLSVGPLPNVEPIPGFPPGSGMTYAWGLHVGETCVVFDWVLGDAAPDETARHLMRKWLGVRS